MSASQKWGFDFVRGCPLDDTKLFLWERVPPTNEIPEMYALSRAAHIRPIEPDRTPSKKRRHHHHHHHHARRDSFLDLYDELHDRSNRYNDSGKNNVLDLSFEDVDGGHTSGSSCDEDSFEDEIDNNMMCDLNWMPTTSKLKPSPCPAATTSTVAAVANVNTSATPKSAENLPVCVGNDDGLATVSKQHGKLSTRILADFNHLKWASFFYLGFVFVFIVVCTTVTSCPVICDTSCSEKSSTTNSNFVKSTCTTVVTTVTATSPSGGSARVLRISPRIREKRQFKITGKHLMRRFILLIFYKLRVIFKCSIERFFFFFFLIFI